MNDYQQYYVYKHIDFDSGKIVYIGIGKSCSAFRCTGTSHRSKEHGEWLENQYAMGNIPVEFIYTGLSKEEARQEERELIIEHRPKFNKDLNPDYTSSRFVGELKETAVALRDMGYSYTKISFLMGGESLVSRENTRTMSIWRMING